MLWMYQTEEIECANTLAHVCIHSKADQKGTRKRSSLRLGMPDPLLNPSARPLLDRGGGALLRPSPPPTEADGGCQGEARLEVDRAEVIEPDWAAGGLDICLANAIAMHC